MTYFLNDAPQNLELTPTTPDVAPQSFMTGLGRTFSQSQVQGDANFRASRDVARTETDLTGKVMSVLGNESVLSMLKDQGLAPDTLQVMQPDLLRNNPQARAAVLDMARTDQQQNPDRWDGIDLSQKGIDNGVNAKLQAERINNQQLINMSPDLGVMGMLSDMAGSIADIRNVVTMIPGLGGGSFLRIVGREALLNMGAEALSLPGQMEMADRLGIPKPSITAELATAAVAGGIFGGAAEGISRGIRAVQQKGVSGAMSDLQRGLTFWRDRTDPPAILGVDAPTAEGMTRAAEDAISAGDDPFEAAQRARGVPIDSEPTGPMTWDEIVGAAQREAGESSATNPPGMPPPARAQFSLPQGETALFQPPPVSADINPGVAILNNARYQAAKAYDPVTFGALEESTVRANSYRRWLDEMGASQGAEVDNIVSSIDRRISEVQNQIGTMKTGGRRRLRDQIRQLQEARTEAVSLPRREETPDVARVPQALVKETERQRDLAPAIGRAFRSSADQADAMLARRLPDPEHDGPVIDVMTGADLPRAPREIRDRQAAQQRSQAAQLESSPAPGPTLDQRTRLFSDSSGDEARAMQDRTITQLEQQVSEHGDFAVDMGDGKGERSISAVLNELKADQAAADFAHICGMR